MTKNYPSIPYEYIEYSAEEMLERTLVYRAQMDRRRTIREFSDRPVAKAVVENIIMTASSAPSGANKQPWTFCAVSDPLIKKEIRIAAEKEEYDSYHGRMTQEWLEDLAPLGTDWHKPFLEIAPWLIVVFKRAYELEDGDKKKNYYVNESVGIACGFLLAAIHNAGLASLTHTPSPMNFLQKILQRPENERPYLLIPIGYPAKGASVPDIGRKSPDDVIVHY